MAVLVHSGRAALPGETDNLREILFAMIYIDISLLGPSCDK